MSGCDSLWIDTAVATMADTQEPYGLIPDGAVAVSDGKIVWVGRRADLPSALSGGARVTHRLEGCLLTPGLIDCHTHLVYGGNRAAEFEQRLEGASYEEIARAGGGIRSTVTATRAADEEALLAAALPRLDAILSEGVTTVEVKSGYGLDLDTERRMLRVARRLEKERAVTIKTTFLGAHTLPPEAEGNADGYIDHLCETVLPALVDEGLVDAVDVFCERIAFTVAQSRRVLEKARDLGLPTKAHAEQLSHLGGTALAAEVGALSADHLEWADAADAAAMAASGTVAVMLPGAYYFLRDTRPPPIQTFREHGVPMAVATDCNPGSSPLTSLLLAMNMAATFFHLTPREALAGTTRHAATALGLGASHGTIETGKQADFAIWDVAEPAELVYRIAFNPCKQTVVAGSVRRSSSG